MKIKNYFLTLIASAAVSVSFLSSCTKDPDESNLYTFTGQTIWDYIQEDPSLTAFCEVLKENGITCKQEDTLYGNAGYVALREFEKWQ